MVGASTALAVFSWSEEEEEVNLVEVSDCNISWGAYLGGGVQGLDDTDREVPHYCWRRTLLLIGLKLASHPKVEFPDTVVAGVVGPHWCKDLTNRADILLYQFLIDDFPLRVQKAITDTLGRNLEERNWLFNAFKTKRDFQTAAEALPLAPGCGLLLEEGCR